MDSYLLIFGFGFVGLLIMAVLGAAGSNAHHHAHGADGLHLHGTGQHGLNLHSETHFHHTPLAHAPHAGAVSAGNVHHGTSTGPAHATHTPHGAHTSQSAHHHGLSPGRDVWNSVLGWLSPRVAFTVALGFGATGALLSTQHIHEPWRAIAALGGGLLLEKAVVAPLWNALMRFGSAPARTLESAVLEEATALTNFDREGCGLVSINLDGHEMRVLGRLSSEYRGTTIRSGAVLLVESVDATRGACTVSPLQPQI